MGGNGGAGSLAGSRGDIQIVSLKESPQFSISNIDGKETKNFEFML